MQSIILTVTLNFFTVFLGLLALWTVMKVMTPKQRARNAAIAGAFSALATMVVAALVAAA